jgi:hypothetical protein
MIAEERQTSQSTYASLSLAGFHRMLLWGALPLEGQAEVVLFLHQYFEHLQVKNI